MNNNVLLLIIAILLFGVGGYWIFFRNDNDNTVNDEAPEQTPVNSEVEINDGPTAAQNTYTRNQYTVENPPKETVDPFQPHKDFEVMLSASKNKADFDFRIPGFETMPTLALEDGKIDFSLKGEIWTAIALEDVTALNIGFYSNDQVSFTKRVEKMTFDFPTIKTRERTTNSEKIPYTFDFEEQLELDPGLYYFLIYPAGRNRVLHTAKFEVRAAK